ncbi:MAG TPA: SUF system NifU family Fe-S cluster assembly protein [Chloroflexota bacterium]|nr:SUF system NifU family Fe-S cluster assembly protein [Chloroflexota bacterium]HEX2514799.1 SUF system NifU family Fe-S cluster assembly protein [Chloroflexota bacterium]
MSQNPLYHDIILEHFEFPRHKGACQCPDASSRGANAMCGDDLLISVRLDSEAEALDEVCWEGRACAIGEASASMMSEAVSGQPKGEARRWVRTVKGLVTGRDSEVDPDLELGDLEALEGIRQYPVRVKCALLAWEALDEALHLAEQKRATHGGDDSQGGLGVSPPEARSSPSVPVRSD